MVSVCYRIHCGDNRISMTCCKACKHSLVPRTILLTTLVSQARQYTKKTTCDSVENFSEDTRLSLFKEWTRLNRQYLVSL